MTAPLFASVWQFVDANVLLMVKRTARGEQPALVDGPDGEIVPLWVDLARAQSGLPDGWLLRQAPMADLLRTLPPHVGIGIEVGAANSVYIPVDQRASLSELGVPFPHGAAVSWGDIPADARGLADALTAKAASLPAVSALWLARFQVEDAREKLACIYAGDEDEDAQIVERLWSVLQDRDVAMPVQIIAITDVPMPTREWLIANVEPLFTRWATDPKERTDG